METSPNNQQYLNTIRADDIMSEVVVTVSEDTIVRDAAHLMLRDRVSGLPVVDKEKNIVGMFVLTDLFILVNKAVAADDYDFYKRIFHEKEIRVKEAMSKKVFTIDPDTKLDEIIRIALTEQVFTLPVIRDGKLVGVVGRHDILNAIFAF